MTVDLKASSTPCPGAAGPAGACRSCGRPTEVFLPFGALPLANALVPLELPAEEQDRIPLTLAICPGCSLVQLVESVDPVRLFRRYVYFSSNSPAYLRHAESLARRIIAERRLWNESLVVEIASNDGYLLQNYLAAGIAVFGIEPAENIANIARARGIETICDFFDGGLARDLERRGVQADVVHAHNVLAHVPDLPGFVAGLATIVKPDGIIIIEVPYLRDLIGNLEFDTVYHEHLCYFALTPLVTLFERNGLQIFDVEHLEIHGGSLRIFARRTIEHAAASVERMLQQEEAWGVHDPEIYRRFSEKVASFRPMLRAFLSDLRATGKSIAAYGASAKGATLLNYCGVDHRLIDFVADRSRAKHGLAMPGVQIPIVAPETLLSRQPDFALILAWNFADEICRQQAEYSRRGGRFIIPVPAPRILPNNFN